VPSKSTRALSRLPIWNSLSSEPIQSGFGSPIFFDAGMLGSSPLRSGLPSESVLMDPSAMRC
jgi:hypothetical protein